MTDTLSKIERSERMSRVKNKNTRPELLVRRLAHSLGYRFRLHCGTLPGRPDLVFPSRRKVLFVHGCFWHRHSGCGRVPKSRLDFWLPKLEKNRSRDLKNLGALRKHGWTALVVWECQLKDLRRLEARIVRFLGP